MSDVRVYKSSIFSCSVCAPAEMSGDAVVAEVNRIHPAGTERGWKKSDDATFATGQPNPCPCNNNPKERQHWLLDA